MDKMELSKRLEQLVGEAAAQEGRLEMTQVLDAFPECSDDAGGDGGCLSEAGAQGCPHTGSRGTGRRIAGGGLSFNDDAELEQPSLVKEEFRWGREHLDPDEMLDGGSMVFRRG